MNIEQLAAQVGFLPADWQLLGKHLERFAGLVRAAALHEAASCADAEQWVSFRTKEDTGSAYKLDEGHMAWVEAAWAASRAAALEEAAKVCETTNTASTYKMREELAAAIRALAAQKV